MSNADIIIWLVFGITLAVLLNRGRATALAVFFATLISSIIVEVFSRQIPLDYRLIIFGGLIIILSYLIKLRPLKHFSSREFGRKWQGAIFILFVSVFVVERGLAIAPAYYLHSINFYTEVFFLLPLPKYFWNLAAPICFLFLKRHTGT